MTPHSSYVHFVARLSQDLAKDLAILAREIHDVAGDGDPQISEVENGATSSTAAAHEQVAPRNIFIKLRVSCTTIMTSFTQKCLLNSLVSCRKIYYSLNSNLALVLCC